MNDEEIKVNDEKLENEVEILDLGVNESEFNVIESIDEAVIESEGEDNANNK